MHSVMNPENKAISIRAFRIDGTDNVATLLDAAAPGDPLTLLGESGGIEEPLIAAQPVPAGHKIALCDIREGEDIIKYGVVIGRAAAPVKKGCLVHIPLIRSLYDERSGHLDPATGKPGDISYE